MDPDTWRLGIKVQNAATSCGILGGSRGPGWSEQVGFSGGCGSCEDMVSARITSLLFCPSVDLHRRVDEERLESEMVCGPFGAIALRGGLGPGDAGCHRER